MRYIQKFSEPDILKNKKNEWTKNFIESQKNRPDSSKYGHNEIKNKLLTISHNKCFYCESLLKGSTKEIDHFIEVAEDKTLAYEWENLYLSCDNCNDKIPNKDIPVKDVLDPCKDYDDEIRKHISFEDEQITYYSDKGEKTVKKFKLSSEKLDLLRSRELSNFKKILLALKDKQIKESRKGLTEDEKNILKRFSKSDHSYSMMFSEQLSKHNII
jgi:uncharacterized protein (TIGR02646 family)